MLQRSKILLGGVLSVGLITFAALPAFAICASGNDMIFQCATAPNGTEQITVCKDGDTAFLSRHTRATGEMYFDIPLGMDPERDFLVEELDEDTGLSIQMGFWDADRDTAHILQFRAGWDSDADDYSPEGMQMWLQTPDWQREVEQTLCKGSTVLFDPEPLFALTVDRGPLGHFYSIENILPEPSLIGRFRVAAPDGGIPVYASSTPNAATPRWTQLYDGTEVVVIDRIDAFSAVALPQGVVLDCMIGPNELFQLYRGPCSTGWVETRFLDEAP